MLTLGGIPPYHIGQIQWAALNQNYFYGVNFLDVQGKNLCPWAILTKSVNGKSIGVPSDTYNPNTSIVDSGTVMPTLPLPAFAALRELVVNNCSNSNLVGTFLFVLTFVDFDQEYALESMLQIKHCLMEFALI